MAGIFAERRYERQKMNINVSKDLWTYLKDTDKTIVIYGMGNGADKVFA